jgi:hypothetical protein
MITRFVLRAYASYTNEKTLIDVDQSRTRNDYITIECRMYNCIDGNKAWALELVGVLGCLGPIYKFK